MLLHQVKRLSFIPGRLYKAYFSPAPCKGQPGKAPPQYMPAPAVMEGVPQGLEYLAQIDQLLVNQQVELLECSY